MQSIYELEYTYSKDLFSLISRANYTLGKLSGQSDTIPNRLILLKTLPLQEAQESSAIENVFTTTEKLYQTDESPIDASTKEVKDYGRAIVFGYEKVATDGLLTNNLIIKIQEILCGNKAGFRKTPGTVIKDNNENIIYTPPQNPEDIIRFMNDLERYIHDDEVPDDPIVKMALIHFQFENIHPFYDGNGRTGRIINILYLIKQGLLASPILYLSRYVIKHKALYYRLFQEARESGDFRNWIEFFALGIIETAESTLKTVQNIRCLLQSDREKIKALKISKRRDLLDHIFIHPSTTRKNLAKELSINSRTAQNYLENLAELELVQKITVKNKFHYINQHLLDILTKVR